MRYVVFVLLLATSVGCRPDPRMDVYLAHLNSEKRSLEDLVYDQQHEIEMLEGQVAKLRKQDSDDGKKPGVDSGATRRRRRTFDDVDQTPQAPPDVIEGTPIHPKPPEPEPAEETPPKPAPPAKIDPPAPSALPAPNSFDSSGGKIDSHVTQIALNPVQTGGDNFDGEPGDDGFTVVVEPRNAAGQFVPEVNKISVVLCDPSREGRESFLARWDFDPETVAQNLRKTDPGRGVRLQIPWPGAAPTTPRLQVFVRYQTESGEKFDADREIFVRLPGQFSERWTPRLAPRESAIVKRNRPARDVAPASFEDPVDARPLAKQPRTRLQPVEDGEPTLLDEYREREANRPRPSWQPQR